MNYTYDANGRQLSASAIGGSPSQTSVYDCLGQRVQTTSGGVTRTMVYDIFGNQIADYNGATLQRENIYRAGQLLALSEGSALSYVLTDLQGATRALMNNSGSGTSTITSRHDYLPFGEEIGAGVGLRTTAQKYSQTNNVRSRFAMLERDDVSGLDHTWFRKHESRAGRWTSPDPILGGGGDPQSLNRYSYAVNDPVNLIDPNGLLPCVPGDRSIHCGWESISAGFWGAGDLNNRRRPRDWALEDKPPALQCPANQICFWQSLDDKRYKLVNFLPSDFRGVTPKRDVGPTRRNAEADRKAYFADKLKDCIKNANETYRKQREEIDKAFVNKVSFYDDISQVTTLIAMLTGAQGEVRGTKRASPDDKIPFGVGFKVALRGALKSVPAGAAINIGYAYAAYAPQAVAYKQAHDAAIQSCYSLWHKK
jgi:RHS repeat-associated protein